MYVPVAEVCDEANSADTVDSAGVVVHGVSASQVPSMSWLAAQHTQLFATATHQQAFEYIITLPTHSQAGYSLKVDLHTASLLRVLGEILFLSRSCLAWIIKLAVRQGIY
jgi:hypothetical protein